MNRQYARIGLLLLTVIFLGLSPAVAETINFDDLDPVWSHLQPVPPGYAGLDWKNFTSMHVATEYGKGTLTGYVTGMVTPEFIVFNENGLPAEFSSKEPFTFVSACLTAAWLDGLEITVEGYLDEKLVETVTVTVSPAASQSFTFDFKGVNRVTFTPSGGTAVKGITGDGTFFALDNLEIADDTPQSTSITIDIKPGDRSNVINPKSKGVIPVAILTTDSFDATTVEPATALFGPTGTEARELKAAVEDVNGDRRPDMLLFFATVQTGVRCGDIVARLTAQTSDGTAVEGSDSIRTVPCK